MDYKAQIQHLKNKNLIIEDDNFAIHIQCHLLKQISVKNQESAFFYP